MPDMPDLPSALRHGELLDRRAILGRLSTGIFGAALVQLLNGDSAPAADVPQTDDGQPFSDLRPRPPHFAAKAKSVIQLFMNGGPSQMDLFDPKPTLDQHHGEDYFNRIAGEVENPSAAGSLMRSPFSFAQHGECGMWVSSALPELAKQVDSLALVRSMVTTNLTHEPALYIIHSGKMGPGRPTLGSWVVYGLGSESQNLPAFVVLDDPLGLPINGVENWQAGFLPPQFQGTRFRSTGSPLLHLQPENPFPERVAQLQRAFLSQLDARHAALRPNQAVLGARIASYELAARMQMAASDALDLTQETAATHALYGIGQEPTNSYGRRCLFARRLVERGVRFVQIFINAQIWDNHTNLAGDMLAACQRTDLPIAGLLQDLKQRGLLDSTLVVWGGEFGRLPIAQLPADKDASKAGRDHNKNAFSCWLAGGGVRPGVTFGATDELGLKSVEDPVSVADWHATILHLLGMRYDQLSIKINGLEEKLTGVEEAKVIRAVINA